jgi:hypothetical protein
MTPEDVRAAFVERAVGAPAFLTAQLRNAKLPEACDAFAQSKLANRLDGIRLLFVSWTPRPPLAPEEEVGFFEVLTALIERQADSIVDELIEQRAKSATIAQRGLQEWQRKREAWSDRPSREAVAAMKDVTPQPELEVVNQGNGRFTSQYNLREDPEDIRLRERIARNRAERAAQEKAERERNGQ